MIDLETLNDADHMAALERAREELADRYKHRLKMLGHERRTVRDIEEQLAAIDRSLDLIRRAP